MIQQVSYTVKARKDVAREWQYLFKNAQLPTAERFVDAVERTSHRLLKYPQSGIRSSFSSPRSNSIRQIVMDAPFSSWLIFYVPTAQGILVYRLLHGNRDLNAQL